MIALLGFAFLSGLITILSPCIWPILPIILSSSVAGGHKRPLGVVIGVMLSFGLLTLFLSFLIKLFHIDPNLLRLLAVVVLIILGLSMVIPKLNLLVDTAISKLTSLFGITRVENGNGFIPGFISGALLGVVWSPCAGPILAAIATLSATQSVSGATVAITLFYIVGAGIPLFIFALGGQRLISKTKFISSQTGHIQKIFGVLMILSALAIYKNYDQLLQLKLLEVFPALDFSSNLLNNNSVTNQLDLLKGVQPTNQVDSGGLFNENTKAPDFIGITKWLNTDKPISIKDLKGKVVLVDFWTYTCINCIRTLPHVTSWYDKYKDQGFVVIGVHTPEFEFEKDTTNVSNAIGQYGIHYPVAQDNNYSTWTNYQNEYWPAEYLIDATGNIRRTHFGEGEYDQTEQAIQTLLKQAGEKISNNLDTMPDQTPQIELSPETYLGSKRMQFYYPGQNTGDTTQNFTLSSTLPLNSFSLGGNWSITSEYAMATQGATLEYNFYSNKVFLVLSPGQAGSSTVRVFLDNKLVTSDNAGSDVKAGVVIIDSDRLYNLIDFKGNPGTHLLKLEFQSSGVEAFAFTFG